MKEESDCIMWTSFLWHIGPVEDNPTIA